MGKRFGSVTPCHREKDLIGGFLDLMKVDVNVIVIAEKTFQGNKIKHDKTEKIALEKGAIVIRINTSDQNEMRNTGLALLKGMGIEYAFIADVDEWFEPEAIKNIKKYVEENPAEVYALKMKYLFRKSCYHITTPDDGGTILVARTDQKNLRFKGREVVHLPQEVGTVYHLSYVRTPEKIKEKIANFSHAKEVIDGWYENVFLPFNPGMKNVSPTSPSDFRDCKIIDFPFKDKLPKELRCDEKIKKNK